MGGASSSILVHAFSCLYGSSGGEIELQEIVNGLINTQISYSPGISIALIFITVGIGFKLSPAPFHQWTQYAYEGVRILTYMLLDISTNHITFACIVLFGLRTGTDNIRDYTGLYTKDPFLALSSAPCLLSCWGLPPLVGELSMIVCVIASYIPGISMNPIFARPGGLSGEDPTTHFLPPAPLRKQGLTLHLNRVLNCLT
ncbi:hypothetical protein Cgig2_003620 [Carnegiea gigantea]|uniref:NADH:quinone oxidoreductase/Mrp antiporter transmembrane domain-containing protein n=1 Tax=Carnegiea gigantea TaxID=171969 RepID=A0A9Q1GJ00_9CARY|nr:hypothetical protein Cgig2_003620 [Carnegiea gigantea]